MRIVVSSKDLSEQKADLAVAFAYEHDTAPRGVTHAGLRRELSSQMKAEDFRGRPGDRLVWNANGRYPSHRFLVVGLGPQRKSPGEAIRLGCARAARSAARFSARSLGLRLPEAGGKDAAIEARAATEGAMLGAYRFDRYLTDPARREVSLESIELAADRATAQIKRSVGIGEIGAQAVWLARDLVNEAPSTMTPPRMAAEAAQRARAAGLRCRVLRSAELRRLGMHALMAVSRGSSEPPLVVHLVYKPGRSHARAARKKQKVVLVGKGVTFDSGGLNLKPGDSMLTMKCDMAGAAAVLAAITALPRLGCPIEVHALLGLVENMTGPSAYKPGDIVKTYSGKTVEIGNTDAEGRLVLCDLLAYAAARIGPTHVVDLATLTGACVVALGTRVSGLFSRQDWLRDDLIAAGGDAGEKLWPLPLVEEYLELLQRGPADLCNVGGRWGGAITAALFLGEFLPRSLPWAHLDIAGPAFSDKDQPDSPQGGTGAGVLTLLRWLEHV